MAQADHLPIFKASYDLCLHLEQVVERFSRSHRVGLGSEIRASARRALGLVVRANSREDKVPLLLELREEIESLKVQLRLCHDVKARLPDLAAEEPVRECRPWRDTVSTESEVEMAQSLAEIEGDALQLSEEERARLAVRLLASLEEEAESPEEIEKLWLVEAEQRFQELRDGVARGIPAREVFARLRAKLSP